MDYARQQAESAAMRDYENGTACNPCRYGARPHSAWSSWYTAAYIAFEGAHHSRIKGVKK